MAEQKIINYQDKQKLVFHNNNPVASEIKAYGDKLMDSKRYYDAIEFYEKAGFTEGLDKLKTIIIEEGDLFLLKFYARKIKTEISKELYEKISNRAFELKKFKFAKDGFKASGNQLMLDKIKELESEIQEGSVLNKVPPKSIETVPFEDDLDEDDSEE